MVGRTSRQHESRSTAIAGLVATSIFSVSVHAAAAPATSSSKTPEPSVGARVVLQPSAFELDERLTYSEVEIRQRIPIHIASDSGPEMWPERRKSISPDATLKGAAAADMASSVGPRDRKPRNTASATSADRLFDDDRAVGRGTFSFEARSEMEAQRRVNFGLGVDSDKSLSKLAPEVRFDFSWRPNSDLLAFVSVEVGQDLEKQRNRSRSSTERVELREAFLLFEDIVDDVEVQLGRQDFEDGREWLYDDRLDALRLTYDENDLKVSVAYSADGWIRKDLLHGGGQQKMRLLSITGEYELADRWDVSAFMIRQQESSGAERRIYLGIQSEGDFATNIGHWFAAALLRGRDGEQTLKGFGVDAGVIFRLPIRFSPALFVGYAYGSGGSNRTTNRSFRQTGLQDNEDRISGLGNAKYYGELLDPELSNLAIVTGGVGFRPSSTSSLELIVHKYKQAVADDSEIADSPVEVQLSGRSRDVGLEIDLIGSIRLSRRLGLEAKLGYFRPGAAFDDRDGAILLKTRLVYRFRTMR